MTSKIGKLAAAMADDRPRPLKPRQFDSQRMLKVRASELRPDDYLIGSRRYVRYVERQGSRVRVDTETLNRKLLTGYWNARTNIGILR